MSLLIAEYIVSFKRFSFYTKQASGQYVMYILNHNQFRNKIQNRETF